MGLIRSGEARKAFESIGVAACGRGSTIADEIKKMSTDLMRASSTSLAQSLVNQASVNIDSMRDALGISTAADIKNQLHGITGLKSVGDNLASGLGIHKLAEFNNSIIEEVRQKALDDNYRRRELFDTFRHSIPTPKFTVRDLAAEKVKRIVSQIEEKELDVPFGEQLLVFIEFGADQLQVGRHSFEAINPAEIQIKTFDGSTLILEHAKVALRFVTKELTSRKKETLH